MRHTTHRAAALFFCLCTLIPAGVQAQAVDASASKQFSTTPAWIRYARSLGWVKDMDAGKTGEAYVAGPDMFVRYDQDGEQIWTREAALNAWQRFNYMKIYLLAAGDDRMYTSEGRPSFLDPLQLTAAGTAIGIYSLDGEPLRVIPVGYNDHYSDTRFAFPEAGWILGMGLDEADNIYALGIYNKRLLFGPDRLDFSSGPEGYDIFLASYTSEGTPRWGRRIEGDSLRAISTYCGFYNREPDVFTVDRHGNTYFGGCFGEGAVFGEGEPNEVTFSENARALASYDADGNLRWVRTMADLGIQEESFQRSGSGYPDQSPYIWDMAVDPEGNFFAGWHTDAWQHSDPLKPVMVGDAALTDPGGSGAFLTKHSPDGDILWVRQMVGPGSDNICALATDSEGHVYVGGYFSGPVVRLGERQLVRDGEDQRGFAARYDQEGALRWAAVYSRAMIAVTVSAFGDLYFMGSSFPYDRCFGNPGGWYFLAKYAASTITSSEPVPEIPATAALASNYPNPFTHATTIEYALPASGPVRLAVYDALGREVATLAQGVQHAGRHTAVFDGTSLPSGVYMYRLEAAGRAHTGLMTLRK